ncbi:MAG: nucleoside triphosphate pyrophosphohydrolase [Bacteroidetes bacterium]|nr:nucleoside triphosphate pyrophosphohydrolase [Bacteroidota bacterium]
MTEVKRKMEAFERLLGIMDELREKCPWDKKQTMQSLRHLTIEEVYELGDAILEGDDAEIKKELGDILLHIVFYAKIASETGKYDIADVIDSLCEKLIHRHPHIYGDVVVGDDEEVSRNWEKLKLKEGKTSVLEGVPVSLPAVVKSMRIQEKARAAGFDWEEKHQVWEKVKEEMNEFYDEAEAGNVPAMQAEFGDLLFSLVNYARVMGINPEESLERTNKKFINRFRFMEDRVREKGLSLADLNLAEMDVFWNEAKKNGL